MILGTLEYMAPEQLEGKEADARTDIFALGVVIYEMATGRKAFEGDSKASLIAKILTFQPPPIETIQPVSPPELDDVVQTVPGQEAGRSLAECSGADSSASGDCRSKCWRSSRLRKEERNEWRSERN